MQEKKYHVIVDHYESCLERHGDSHLGVDWPKKEDVDTRYRVMLELVRDPRPGATLLDFGCGAAHLYEYMQRRGMDQLEYAGLDLGASFVDLARSKFPDRRFYGVDVLEAPDAIPDFDYVVMNGVLTEKRELSFDEMWAYTQRLLRAIFARTRVGLAFNVMSKHVDWEREDLFHLPFDLLAGFLRRELSRHFVFRLDYGLYEYTTYVYR
jgi:SAM-dependent methyltransferase